VLTKHNDLHFLSSNPLIIRIFYKSHVALSIFSLCSSPLFFRKDFSSNLHFVSNTRAPVTPQLQAENGSKHETAQPFLKLNITKTVLTCYRRILFSSNGKLRIHHKTLPIVLIFFAFKFNRSSTSWPTQKLLVHTRRTFRT
jgi:hypothetical protein